MSVIESFATVDVSDLSDWLGGIPMSDWPKMADPDAFGCGDWIRSIALRLMGEFPGCAMSGVGLFLLAPGQEHPAHKDEQPPEWVTRVHLPVITNPLAVATTEDGEIHMQAGVAYKFNTRATHAVRNDGEMPRVHLVFDVTRNH